MTAEALDTPIVKRRLDYSRTGLWPAQPMEINPVGWLSNFDSVDRDVAASLLDSFIYFNEDMTLSLMRSAFSAVSARDEFRAGSDSWTDFLSTAIFTAPTGEVPSPTDSGYLLMRTILRQKFRISQDQLLDPSHAVRLIDVAASPRPIVLIDDFIGSGDQLLATWQREYPTTTGIPTSLEHLYNSKKIPEVYATAALTTNTALCRITEVHPYMKVASGHFLDSSYSAASSNTILVPEKFKDSLKIFIEKYSLRIGLDARQAYGHGLEGYNLAFQHSVPDLTLPIIWTETDTWTPLVKRH